MSKPVRQVLQENIKTLMSRRPDLTAAKVADQAGISRGQMHNITTMKSATTVDTLEGLAAVFGIQPALLLYVQPRGLGFFEFLDRLQASRAAEIEDIDFSREAEALLDVDLLEAEEVYLATAIDGTGPEPSAVTALIHCFMHTDEEGKAALLRHAAAEVGMIPDIAGDALPREWRNLAAKLATAISLETGWPAGEPETVRWIGPARAGNTADKPAPAKPESKKTETHTGKNPRTGGRITIKSSNTAEIRLGTNPRTGEPIAIKAGNKRKPARKKAANE